MAAAAEITFSTPNIPDFVKPIEVEVVKYRYLGDITAKYVNPPLNILNEISGNVKQWIYNNQPTGENCYSPEPKQYCLVKWPKDWNSVSLLAKFALGLFWLAENIEDPHAPIDVFAEDYAKFGGKWFRAECIAAHKNTGSLDDLYEMYLVDLGKTTLIPGCNVQKIPKHLMIYPTMAFRLSLYIPDVLHYDANLDNKWKYLLQEGLRLTVKVFWIRKGVHYSKLIKPTGENFEKHFQEPQVQFAIKKWEEELADRRRHRLVKSKATMKGSYPSVMQEELQKEAKEKKREPLKKQYAGMGKVHHDRVFLLKEPNPIPKEFRDKNKYEIVE